MPYSFIIPGTASLRVTLTELQDGSLRFDLQNEGDEYADLRGLFFDTNDSSLLSGLIATGDDISGSSFAEDSVSNLGGGVNMSGQGVFDAGISFGTSGIGEDDIGNTSFVLHSSNGPLEIEDFAGVTFGVRFTSVGEAGGQREDSLKLIVESPEYFPDSGDVIEFPPPGIIG